MKTDTSNTDTVILTHTEAILKLAKDQIYTTLDTKESLGITALSEEIAKTRGVEQSFAYAVISTYVTLNKDLVCVKGKGNGIMFQETYTKRQAKQNAEEDDRTISKFTKTVQELGYKDKAQFNSAKRTLGEKPSIKALKSWLLEQKTV